MRQKRAPEKDIPIPPFALPPSSSSSSPSSSRLGSVHHSEAENILCPIHGFSVISGSSWNHELELESCISRGSGSSKSMACRGFWECLLKLLNFLLTLAGLAMVGYGIYLFVEWERSTSDLNVALSDGVEMAMLGRPLLMSVPVSTSFLDNLPKAWFIYLFIGIGVILFVVSCFGCIGLATRHGCCLSCYSILVLLLILVELAFAAFIYFDHSWQDVVPTDSTGDFDMIYDFIEEHWNIAKWVALGVVILEVLTFLLALVVRAVNSPPGDYDSDDEYIVPRSGIRQPLVGGRPGVPATGVPMPTAPDQRIVRNDAWSTRMREKYGLDTTEFTYNPSESNRYQQQAAPPTEERSRCIIM